MAAVRVSALGAVVLAYVAIGILWVILIPPFESPDEIHHFTYVQFVANVGRLPVQTQETLRFLEHEAHQPPLYYATAALIYRLALSLGIEPFDTPDWQKRINPDFSGRNPSQGQDPDFFIHREDFFHPQGGFPYDLIVIRLFSLSLGIVTLLLVYTTCLAVWPNRNRMALAATGLVAFLPQFSFITAAVNNDAMAIVLGALCLHRLAHIARERDSTHLLSYPTLGFLLGAGLLAKLTILSLLPVALLLPLLMGKRGRKLVSAWGMMVGGLLLAGGWWFARNLLLYGDLLGDHWKINPAYFAWDLAPKSLLSDYFLPQHFWRQTGESFFGKFGFAHIAMPSFVYGLYWGLLALGLLGILLLFWREKMPDIPTRIVMSLMGLAFLFAVAQLVYLNLQVSQPQGRYLFHVFPALAILLVTGLSALRAEVTGVGHTVVEDSGSAGIDYTLGSLALIALAVVDLASLLHLYAIYAGVRFLL